MNYVENRTNSVTVAIHAGERMMTFRYKTGQSMSAVSLPYKGIVQMPVNGCLWVSMSCPKHHGIECAGLIFR